MILAMAFNIYKHSHTKTEFVRMDFYFIRTTTIANIYEIYFASVWLAMNVCVRCSVLLYT